MIRKLIFILIICINASAQAQTKTVYLEEFKDNKNTWPQNGKKLAINSETGYIINNDSRQNFIALQSFTLDPAKDYTIIFEQKGLDKPYTDAAGGLFFGASDSLNGYSASINGH